MKKKAKNSKPNVENDVATASVHRGKASVANGIEMAQQWRRKALAIKVKTMAAAKIGGGEINVANWQRALVKKKQRQHRRGSGENNIKAKLASK
jgi:hypothetical protein